MDSIKAIVLHNIDYKDNSKILYLYTDDGHKSVIAHGVKKLNNINRFLSQNGTEIACTFSKGSFPSLRDGELLNDYAVIKKDIIAYTYMNHIMELVRNTISDDLDHRKMYRFIKNIFQLMNDKTDPELLAFVFELKLLYFLGNGLHFQECVVCGKQEHLVFHVSSGGLICPAHLEPMSVTYDRDLYDTIRYLYYMDISIHPLIDLDNNHRILIRNIIDQLFDEFVGYKTKSREILRQIKKY